MAASIAIIIPTLNEERVLPRTLQHLVPHQFNEVIVVDGGSLDRTMSVLTHHLTELNMVEIQVIETDRGRAKQMNAGAAAARSDILLFLHADTQLPDGCRSDIERVMSNPACVGGRFDVQFEKDRGWAWLISRMMNLRSRWSGIATGDQAIFVRREIFNYMDGYANIPLMEDIEFTKRLKQFGHVATLHAKVTTSFRRWEQRGALPTIIHMWTLRLLYWMGFNPHTLQQFYATIR
ncbi:TIGR04283 family arsenosugar biosynthesis glycosyltransferase [Candidatus Nitronereus thalassa]|uniref:TIGR04283 family arsenosugar biosynthesis glycosyltransferase n=1 Tax=Candidatus Nitronereus thalassa TaxID=3020898 RepID=A0ABU3KAF4_9BACT|nr:TIGR04283 family arsenosugar biosynthesis glycosyltransferase [Candidatus Nitronereus thalassa]MDT7043254.1 TIGR04283 family arsenosugar biosynthesis glycosyltransferase [Candidatus Nitronereus thalassa]